MARQDPTQLPQLPGVVGLGDLANRIAPIPPPPEDLNQGMIQSAVTQQQALNRPGAGFAGKAGQVANIATSFLHGIASGRLTAARMQYAKLQTSLNDAAVGYGMARQNLLPLQAAAQDHTDAKTGQIDPAWLKTPDGQKYTSTLAMVTSTRQNYINLITQNVPPQKKTKKKGVLGNIEAAGKSILEGGPSIPEGLPEAALGAAQQLPTTYSTDEIQAYRASATAPQLKQALMLSQIEHEQAAAGAETNAAALSSAHAAQIKTQQDALGQIGANVAAVQSATDPVKKRQAEDALLKNVFVAYPETAKVAPQLAGMIAPTTIPHEMKYTAMGPDGKAHVYTRDEVSRQVTDLGLAPPTRSGTARPDPQIQSAQEEITKLRGLISSGVTTSGTPATKDQIEGWSRQIASYRQAITDRQRQLNGTAIPPAPAQTGTLTFKDATGVYVIPLGSKQAFLSAHPSAVPQ